MNWERFYSHDDSNPELLDSERNSVLIMHLHTQTSIN